MWHRVADQLAHTYTVIALDLRGYGKSSKPPSDDRHETYSKRTMAHDCIEVMRQLGYDKFYICAHDRGARVAHKLLIDYPKTVIKAMLLDICPTLAMYNATDFIFASAYWHWFFLIQPAPFPEDLILSNPEAFALKQLGRVQPGVFDEGVHASYTEMMKDPTGVHAMCEDYRAAASIDMEEHKHDEEEGRKIQCPLMVVWGKQGLIEKKFDAVAEWQKVSGSTVEGASIDCGHFIPEEAPEATLQKILGFLKE